VLAACRVGGSQQSAIDTSVEPLLPGMAPLVNVNGATGCINDHLANFTEASCPPKSEGDHPAQGHHADAHCVRHYKSEGTCENWPKTSLKFAVSQGIASPSSVWSSLSSPSDSHYLTSPVDHCLPPVLVAYIAL